jgi:hypothetical protein
MGIWFIPKKKLMAAYVKFDPALRTATTGEPILRLSMSLLARATWPQR